MNLEQIKEAIAAGKKVYWSNKNYIIEHDKSINDYNILSLSNNHRIGLTWADGITLNAKEQDFFTE